MASLFSFEEIKNQIASGEIDTVLTCIVDMQGRLMGKRFHAEAFLEIAQGEGTHCCNYLLATDLEMATPNGYVSTSWESGYGDYSMRPDMSTLRPMPWLNNTLMVLCDVEDHATHKPVKHSPRQILKNQVARANAMGFDSIMATELEFFLFQGSYQDIAACGFSDLKPISNYNEDYHILQTSKEEVVMQPIRNYLRGMGLPIEGSKGEAEAGQEELNIKFDHAILTADYHTIAKHAIKEIANQHGVAASFLPKWHKDRVGSASHVHQSLWKDGENVFFDPSKPHGKSKLMDHYMAGLLKYAKDYMYFMAPYINSYKRFAKGTFAPTQIIWSIDNRTSSFRLCGEDSKSIRVECRIPGADANPYLALASMLAAGLSGIEEELQLSEAFVGNAYTDSTLEHFPNSLQESREKLVSSQMLRSTFGEDVIDHYARAAEWEIEEFSRVVTDYEIARGFERA